MKRLLQTSPQEFLSNIPRFAPCSRDNERYEFRLSYGLLLKILGWFRNEGLGKRYDYTDVSQEDDIFKWLKNLEFDPDIDNIWGKDNIRELRTLASSAALLDHMLNRTRRGRVVKGQSTRVYNTSRYLPYVCKDAVDAFWYDDPHHPMVELAYLYQIHNITSQLERVPNFRSVQGSTALTAVVKNLSKAVDDHFPLTQESVERLGHELEICISQFIDKFNPPNLIKDKEF